MPAVMVSGRSESLQYPELEGTRVLLTGLSTRHGVDLARGFADHHCRLVIQMEDTSPEAEALIEILAQSAGELEVTAQPLAGGERATAFAQGPAQSLGGLDAAVNLIALDGLSPRRDASVRDIDEAIAERLRPAFNITRVVANRMLTTWVAGSILNVLYAPAGHGENDIALACIARSALAAMTRAEAGQFAEQSIRINAAGPRDLLDGESRTDRIIKSEPEIAALALRLASERGRSLSGHVFDLHVPAPPIR
jgi:3-oxoacyl-[acyl-carrier protein] reductase